MNSTFIFDIQYQEQIPIIFQKKKSYLRTRVIWRLNAYRARYNSRPFPSLITLITLPLLLTPSHGISLGRMERSSIQRIQRRELGSIRFGPPRANRTHRGGAEKRGDSHGNASRPQMLALAQARERRSSAGHPPACGVNSINWPVCTLFAFEHRRCEQTGRKLTR